jgi:outer membrane protein assembly factor BamA
MGWQNTFDSRGDSTLLANHRAVLEQALTSLKDIRYAGSREAVAAIRQLMLATPQIYFEDAANTCAEILRSLPGTGEALAISPYELCVTGNKAFSTAKLEETFAQALADYQHLPKPYTPNMFKYALDRISNLISSQGYTANGSGPSPPGSSDDSKDVVWSEIGASDHLQYAIGTNKQGVIVMMHVNEGERYRLGSVRISGAHLLSAEQIREMLPLRSGDACDFVAIGSWRSNVEQAYKNRGYLQISVDDESDQYPAKREEESGTINFSVKIEEGRPFKVKSITFAGNTEIASAKLLRALKLGEGELYSEEKLDASVAALNELGLEIDKERDVHADEDEERGVVRIVIIVDRRTSRRAAGGALLERRVRRIFN